MKRKDLCTHDITYIPTAPQDAKRGYQGEKRDFPPDCKRE